MLREAGGRNWGLRVKGYQIGLAVVVLALAGIFCLRPPAIPQWDTELTVPLFTGQLRLCDVLDSTRFRFGPDSALRFALAIPCDTVRPDAALDIVGVDEVHRLSLSDFLLRDLGRTRTRFELAEIVGQPIPDSGLKVRLEPFLVTCEHQVEIDGVAHAQLATGLLRVRVANFTPLDYDSMVVGVGPGLVRLDGLSAGEARDITVDLSGEAVSSPLTLRLTGGSPGTRGDTVRMAKHDSLLVECRLDSVRLERGRVRVPAASATKRCAVRMTRRRAMRIDSLELREGRCGFVLANDFGIPLDLQLQVPRLAASRELNAGPHTAEKFDMDMAGLVIDHRSPTNALFEFLISGATHGIDTLVNLDKDDAVVVSHSTSGIRLQIVVGLLREPVYVASRMVRVPLSMPGGVSGLRMSKVELGMWFASEVGFPMDLMLTVRAWREGTPLAAVERTLTLAAGGPGRPSVCEGVMPLAELVNLVPDELTFEYGTRIRGEGRLEHGAAVVADAAVSAPLRLAVVPDTVELPARRLQLSEQQRELVHRHLVSGSATLILRNHLPFGVGGRIVIAPDSGASRPPDCPVESLVLPFAIAPGRVDRQGNCVDGVESELAADIDSLSMGIFQCRPLAVRAVFELPATDTVVLHAGDRAAVEALVRLRVRIEE